MGHQVWGVYSVQDHKSPHAFVADVMVYDRLVLPVPPGPSWPESAQEWARWRSEGWEPDAQADIIRQLGNRAYPVPWGTQQRQQWEVAWSAARASEEAASPYRATGGVLMAGLPPHVTGMNAVATFPSGKELESASGLRHKSDLPSGQAVKVIAREFLAPDPDEHRSDADLLRAALDLSGDRDFRRKRASYWRWQRDFIHDNVISEMAMQDAVEEMGDLINDELREIRRQKIKTITLFTFCVASAGAALLAAPLTPVAIGGAFLSVGQFAAERIFSAQQTSQPSPAALFIDARKQLGWK